MDFKKQIEVNWFIVFTRSKCKTGVMKWLKRDFSHVYAMKKSFGGQFWIVVNPLMAVLDCHHILVEDFPHPRMYAGPTAVILPVKAKIIEKERWAFCVFNCVEVVKALLGVRAFWIWTPWQLYKYLTRGKREN